LVSTFKEDSNGMELTEEQLNPIYQSRALDEQGRIKVVNLNGKDGYYDIRKPFDTRTRRNAALTDEFIMNNYLNKSRSGLLSETDARLFLAYISEQGLDYDGITYNDNGSLGYIPLEDTQFFALDSLEYANAVLNDLKGSVGAFENIKQQVANLENNATKQIIKANVEFYEHGYNEYLKFETNALDYYENNEDFRAEIDEVFNKYREYEYETTLDELKEEMFSELKAEQQKRFSDDYRKYNEWSKINTEDSTVVVNNKLRQNPFSKYTLEKARLEYGLDKLTPSQSLEIYNKTIENFSKDRRFFDVYEMIDPNVLIEFKDFNRLDKPSFKENFKVILDSVLENGFNEPIWLLANEHTGFTLVGEGNHRMFLALMVGIDRLPVVATRHNYEEPRMATNYLLSNGGYVDVNGIKPLTSYSKPSDVSHEFKPTEIKFQLNPQQLEYFKDSKVRDEAGSLKVVYHGTDSDFNTFDRLKIGRNFIDSLGGGFFFTEDKNTASSYGKNIKNVYLKIVSPLIISQFENSDFYYNSAEIYDMHKADYIHEMRQKDNDGIIIKHKKGDLFVAFDPNQIKSIDNLNPTDDPDIRFQLTEEQKEFFKDSKARDEQGNLMPFYHGTDRAFTVFDNGMIGSSSGDLGYFGNGFYFARDRREARFYGSNILESYLNTKKPFNFTKFYEYKTEYIDGESYNAYTMIMNLLKFNSEWGNLEVNGNKFSDIAEETKKVLDGVKIKDKGLEEDSFGKHRVYEVSYKNNKKTINATLYADKQQILNSFVIEVLEDKFGFVNRISHVIEKITDESIQGNTKSIQDALKELGYDSIIQADNVYETDEIVLFDSNQIKSVDNLNPTSNPDIRFQLYDNPVKDEYGNILKFYHGTPDGSFNEFKSGSYFTTNKEYAEVYKNKNASSISVKKGANNPRLYEVNLYMNKPFDTRNPKERKIFEKEYYRQYGMGSPLTEKGLPDWTDGVDLQEFLEEKGYDYDGLLLDEGGTGGYGEEVKSRGISYVVFNPNQVKDVNNLNPTDSPDIRFQLDPNNPLLKIYSPSLNENETKELTILKSMDNAFGIIPGDPDYKRFTQLLEKEQSLVKFKKLLDVKEYDDVKKEYQKAKKEVNNDTAKYDKQLLNTIKGFVKGYRETGKRTKAEWLFIANQYGSQYKAISQEDLLEQALYTWIILNPNNKDNLNRQGQSFVKFGVEEWIQEMAKAAGGGTIQNLNEVPVQEQRVKYEEKVKQSRHASVTAKKNAPEEIKESIEQQIEKGNLNYIVMSDVISVREANKNIDKNGVDVELQNLKYKFENGEIPTKVEIATGEILLKKLTKERRTAEAIDLLTSLSILGTELGQAIQGLSLIDKLSPSGQLMALEKGLKRIGKHYEQNGRENPNLKVPEEYRNYFMELEGKIQDLAESQQEYNDLVDSLDRLEAQVKSMEEQNKSLAEISKLKNDIELMKQQQIIDAETQKRIDGLQLELNDLNALPNISNDLKQQQQALKNEISALNKTIRTQDNMKANIAVLEEMVSTLKEEVGEDSYNRMMDLKKEVKYLKQKERDLKKLNKMLEKLTGQTEIEAKIDEVKRIIAKQMPVNFMDKVNAWRYLSMLGNPRTHIRNILGNGFFYPVFVAKDILGVAMEQFISKEQRTKSLLPMNDIELKQFAHDDFKEMQKVISSTTKYDLTMDLNFNKQVFKTPLLEAIRNKNFEWLEKEDVLFMKLAYTHSLGMVIKARGWDFNNLTEEQLAEARKIAIDDARKATYRDASKLASTLNQLERNSKVGKFISAAVIPFKKTPFNILKRGIEYSPYSILVGIKQMAFDVKAEKVTVAQALDSITTGMTGMGIMGLGMLLYSMGILNVGDDDDDSDKKRAYDRALGNQRYSINVPGGTYTADWLVPAIMPLILGGELAKAFSKESDETLINQLTNATFSIMDPVFELSMLQGITQTLTSYSSSGAETFGNVISQMVANLVGQFIPTLSGAGARIVDPYQRSTIATKNSPIGKFAEETLRRLANKIMFMNPILDRIAPDLANAKVIDVRGQEVVQFDNIITRAFMNLFSPGYYKDGTITEQDREIIRMYELTKDNAVLPRESVSYYQYKNEYYYLDNKQAETFEKVLGEISYQQLDVMFNSSAYTRLSTDEKAKLIGDVYEFAYNKAKETDLKSREVEFVDSGYAKEKQAEAIGLKVVDYLLIKYEFDNIKADKFNSKRDKFITYLRKMGYGDKINQILPLFKVDIFQ
jgi:hypothetical protein